MADQDAIALLRELLPVAEETCKRWPNDDCYLIPTAKARNFLRASEEQKAPSVERDAARLDKPAQIGGTVFGVGVKWETVIGRAQREWDYFHGLTNPRSSDAAMSQEKKP